MVDNFIKINKGIKVDKIIKNKSIKVLFQPIVYMSRKAICGFEGLSRGIDMETNEIISPIDLFEAAKEQGLTTELDRICREKVLEAFSCIYKTDKEKLLFINIDASILEKVEGSNYLFNQIKKFGIDISNIIIEINETKVKNNDCLERFIYTYRNLGFMIALDDVGSGFSNLNRISISKPDVIKLDMSLIRNIHKDYYKQEVVKSIMGLSNRIGTVVVAEGVELKEEAIQLLRLGAQMIQGFYFSRPIEISCKEDIILSNSIEALNDNFKEYVKESDKSKKKYNGQLNNIISNVLKEIVEYPQDKFNDKLCELTNQNETIECIYIIDNYGIQVSDTIYLQDKNEVKENGLFSSATVGTDHSMKRYYYNLMNTKLSQYITEPYVSMATGNVCITYSKVFNNVYNKNYILCIDFKCHKDLVLAV